jgi:type IV secretory pathway VirB10-like protein
MPLPKAPRATSPAKSANTASTPSVPAKRVRSAPLKTASVKVAKTPAVKPADKVKVVKPAVPKTVAPVAAAKPQKLEKAKKPKLVRDSFTMPKLEYAEIDLLKSRALKLGQVSKKSELLRAGVKALVAMTDSAFLAALAAVPTLKTGRPQSNKP